MQVRVIILLALNLLLPGCANMAVSGAQAVYNHHSLEKNFKDQMITMRAYKAIHLDSDRFNSANITVAAFNGDVLLAGEAPKQWQKVAAELKIKSLPDVDRVYNLVTIANPSSSLTRISDAWITTKVKSKIIASSEIDATQVKVVTENGTVYLMGVLPPSQAATAVDIAKSTDGVKSVVKIFSYIKISRNASLS